jgi:folate-binding protein YgfZ
LVDVGGSHRERFLASQVVSDVVGLAIGESQLSALLNRSGRLQAFFFLCKRAEVVSLLVPDELVDTVIQRLEDHIIADDVSIFRCDTGPMRLALGPAAVAAATRPDRIPVAGWGSAGFATWSAEPLDLLEIAEGELEPLRVLGGPPVWGADVKPDQLVNETSLLETVVSFEKGCYLGQETVAKVASGRGAVRGPATLEVTGGDPDFEVLVGAGFSVGDRKRAGEIMATARWDDRTWLSVSMHREARVIGRSLRCVFDDGSSLDAEVHGAPLLHAPAPEETADRLTIAASAAFAEDRADRALELLDRAITVCPTWGDAYEASGVILGRLGRHREAIERMDRLTAVDPGSIMAHSNLSLFYNQLGDVERAEHHLAMATRLSMGGSVEPAEDEATAARVDRARREEMFRQVLEIDPDDPLAHFGLGELAGERGRFGEAVSHLERAISADPSHAAARMALGLALEELGEADRACEVYESGVAVAAKKGDHATAQKIQDRLNALSL